MIFIPKFCGLWYGLAAQKDAPLEVPEELVAKATSRKDMFTKPRAKKHGSDDD